MSNLPQQFLLEIGAEEIPDWMILPALEQLEKQFGELLAANKLAGKVTRVDATPRRLVLWAEGIPSQQSDSEEILSGPPKAAGAGAAQGFAKKNGVTVEALETLSTAKGEYFAYRKKITGRPTAEILAEALPGLILKLYFPKTMYWTGKGGPRFIRPLRWVVALLGEQVVRFTLAEVESGNFTYGHRKLGAAGPLPVTIADYEETLRKNYVLVSAAERQRRITEECAKLTAGAKTPTGVGLRAKVDTKLMEVLTYITEYPSAIMGSFDAAYLELPSEVLVTVMRHHQKYFSVETAEGKLAPNFLAIMNLPSDPEGNVVRGNERVLRARFNDARFFYEVDQKRPLAARVEDLKAVTFQAKLGSYYDKTQRVVELARQLGGADAARAAELAKADLTTEMVKEFTDLQGIVGGLYAAKQGETAAVAQAIYEHYKPLSMEDSIPASAAGQALSLADKLDTLRGCFSIGMVPTGSKDPFALRRAAQGIVKILVEGQLALPLQPLLGGDEQLESFFRDRIEYYFREVKGYAYDEVNAVLAAGWSDLQDVAARLTAIRQIRPTENFGPVAAGFKRIQNILKQAGEIPPGGVDPALFVPEEQALAQAAGQAKAGLGYEEQLAAMAALRPAVDAFFDKVLVNDPDANIRANRLRLLQGLIARFSAIADFSEIVTS